MTQTPRSLDGVQACVFDAYGTLFDFASAAARCPDIPQDRRAALAALWRDKQLQYSWLRTLENRYADFWQVTGDALDFALESLDLETPFLRERLMDLYLGLEPFPEVPAVLATLREAGFEPPSSPTARRMMLEALVKRSGLEAMFDAVLSADAVRAFKTHPDVYQYALRSLDLPAQRDLVPILQRLGRAWGVRLRHAGRLVQPLWPAPRAPAGPPRLRDPDAGRTAGAARPRTVLSRAGWSSSRYATYARISCKSKSKKSKEKSLHSLAFLWPIGPFQGVTANPTKNSLTSSQVAPSCPKRSPLLSSSCQRLDPATRKSITQTSVFRKLIRQLIRGNRWADDANERRFEPSQTQADAVVIASASEAIQLKGAVE